MYYFGKEVFRKRNSRAEGERPVLFVMRWEPVFQGERILLSIDRTKLLCFVKFTNTKRGKSNDQNKTDFKNDSACYAYCIGGGNITFFACRGYVPYGSFYQYRMLCPYGPLVFAFMCHTYRYNPYAYYGYSAYCTYRCGIRCIPFRRILPPFKRQHPFCRCG